MSDINYHSTPTNKRPAVKTKTVCHLLFTFTALEFTIN